MSRAILACLALALAPVAIVAVADDDAKIEIGRKFLLTVPSSHFGLFDLIEVGADGKNPTRLTRDPKGAMDPSWSPDGRKVAFVSFRDGPTQVYVADADGKNEDRLSDGEGYERSPAWSPDGKKIAFTSNRDGNQEIYVMDADGKNPVNLTNDEAFDADPCWSPDGKRIAFTSNRSGSFRLYLMGADGGEVRDLLARDLRGWTYPAWSPDGKQIALGIPGEGTTIKLALVNADGNGEPKEVDADGAINSYASWSPDGRYLAYVRFAEPPRGLQAGEETDEEAAGGDLMVYDVKAGKGSRVRDGDLPIWGPRPCWRPVAKGR